MERCLLAAVTQGHVSPGLQQPLHHLLTTSHGKTGNERERENSGLIQMKIPAGVCMLLVCYYTTIAVFLRYLVNEPVFVKL